MTNNKQHNDDAKMELLVNLTVATLCGLAVAAFFTLGSLRYFRIGGSGGKLFIIAFCGFILGSGYGFWHAVRGWKRNDAQKAHDDEFNIFR